VSKYPSSSSDADGKLEVVESRPVRKPQSRPTNSPYCPPRHTRRRTRAITPKSSGGSSDYRDEARPRRAASAWWVNNAPRPRRPWVGVGVEGEETDDNLELCTPPSPS